MAQNDDAGGAAGGTPDPTQIGKFVRIADLDYKIAAPISNVSFSDAVMQHDFSA